MDLGSLLTVTFEKELEIIISKIYFISINFIFDKIIMHEVQIIESYCILSGRTRIVAATQAADAAGTQLAQS